MSDLEDAFVHYWTIFASPAAPLFVREFQFAKPDRKWAADFAWPEQKLLVECEGGTFTNGRHVRTYGYDADCEKYNQALMMGYRVLRYTSGMISRDPISVIGQVCAALGCPVAEEID